MVRNDTLHAIKSFTEILLNEFEQENYIQNNTKSNIRKRGITGITTM